MSDERLDLVDEALSENAYPTTSEEREALVALRAELAQVKDDLAVSANHVAYLQGVIAREYVARAALEEAYNDDAAREALDEMLAERTALRDALERVTLADDMRHASNIARAALEGTDQ